MLYEKLQNKRPQPTMASSQSHTPTSPVESKSIVTGPPTRKHWMTDSQAKECCYCRLQFNLFYRRHHCRRCGMIYCQDCSQYTARLDQTASFHPFGVVSRICISCHEENENIKNPPEAPFQDSIEFDSSTGDRLESAYPGTSVPSNWQWSTF